MGCIPLSPGLRAQPGPRRLGEADFHSEGEGEAKMPVPGAQAGRTPEDPTPYPRQTSSFRWM